MKDLIAKLIVKTGKKRESINHMNVETRSISGASDISVYRICLDPTINSHFQR